MGEHVSSIMPIGPIAVCSVLLNLKTDTVTSGLRFEIFETRAILTRLLSTQRYSIEGGIVASRMRRRSPSMYYCCRCSKDTMEDSASTWGTDMFSRPQ